MDSVLNYKEKGNGEMKKIILGILGVLCFGCMAASTSNLSFAENSSLSIGSDETIDTYLAIGSDLHGSTDNLDSILGYLSEDIEEIRFFGFDGDTEQATDDVAGVVHSYYENSDVVFFWEPQIMMVIMWKM